MIDKEKCHRRIIRQSTRRLKRKISRSIIEDKGRCRCRNRTCRTNGKRIIFFWLKFLEEHRTLSIANIQNRIVFFVDVTLLTRNDFLRRKKEEDDDKQMNQ